MGNNPSRNATYEKYYKSINGEQTPDIDPYEIFGLSKNFKWEELKEAYKRTAKLVHPDKGGSEVLFNKVSEAFKLLAYEYKARQEDKQFDELKKGYTQYTESNPVKAATTDYTEGNFIDRFNKAFDDNKFEEDEYGNSVGYGNIMEKSSKVREDISVPKVLSKFNNDIFNKKFDENVSNPTSSKQVTKYSEPEALPLAKSIQYTELGGDKPANFNSTGEGIGERRGGLQYSDYMIAHTTSRLIDPSTIKSRKEYKSVSEYEKTRDKVVKKPPTEEELRQYAKQKTLEKQKEEERVYRLKQRDQKITQHFDKVNTIFIK